MSRTVIAFITKFVLLVLAQAVIFNNIVLFNVAIAFVFILIIVSMPVTWSTNISVTLGFLAGLAIDIFSDTLGVSTLSCTILAFVRKPVFHLYMQSDEDLAGMKPCVRTMGMSAYMKYLLTMSVIYCICFFVVDAFAMFNPLQMLVRIVCSSIFTFIVVYALDSILTRKNEKGL